MEEGHALVLAENADELVDLGRIGQLRAQLAENCLEVLAAEDRSAAAEAEARHRWIAADQESYL